MTALPPRGSAENADREAGRRERRARQQLLHARTDTAAREFAETTLPMPDVQAALG